LFGGFDHGYETHRVSIGTLLPILQGHMPRRHIGSPAQVTPKQNRKSRQQPNPQPFPAVPSERIRHGGGFDVRGGLRLMCFGCIHSLQEVTESPFIDNNFLEIWALKQFGLYVQG
jgi:hypothetical protein